MREDERRFGTYIYMHNIITLMTLLKIILLNLDQKIMQSDKIIKRDIIVGVIAC